MGHSEMPPVIGEIPQPFFGWAETPPARSFGIIWQPGISHTPLWAGVIPIGTLGDSHTVPALGEMNTPGALGDISIGGVVGDIHIGGALGDIHSGGALGDIPHPALGDMSIGGALGDMSSPGVRSCGIIDHAGRLAFGIIWQPFAGQIPNPLSAGVIPQPGHSSNPPVRYCGVMGSPPVVSFGQMGGGSLKGVIIIPPCKGVMDIP